jgi:hypothetical protein
MTILAQSPQKSTYASTQMTVRGRIKPLGFGWLMDDPPECFSFFFPSHHVRLVNRVYPRNPSETSLARPNKLSSLMFYLTTKPSKIIKVSKYLERKVKLDITWKRFGYVYNISICKCIYGYSNRLYSVVIARLPMIFCSKCSAPLPTNRRPV